MAPVPPPQGMSEVDYAAIEAAVTETVRGRWFLNEFARRNRTAELRQLLEVTGRIEGMIAAGPPAALPPADPSIRLLMQRVKEIAGQLDTLSCDMREAGVDERFAAAVEKEARAVSGMMRGPGIARWPATLKRPEVAAAPSRLRERLEPAVPRAEDATRSSPAPSSVAPDVRQPDLPAAEVKAPAESPEDPRLAILAPLDNLPFKEKLALFA